MRDRARDEADVERALSENLIGDVDLAAARVPRFGTFTRDSVRGSECEIKLLSRCGRFGHTSY